MTEYCQNCSAELSEDEEGQGFCDACIDDLEDAALDPDLPHFIVKRHANIRRLFDELNDLLNSAGYSVNPIFIPHDPDEEA